MENIFFAALRLLDTGHPVMLATVIASAGSAPRGPGARMAVPADGDTVGTIGGGAVEYRATALCREALAKNDTVAFTEIFALGSQPEADLGMACGGEITVLFQPLHSAKDAEWCRAAAALTESGKPGWLLVRLAKPYLCTVWEEQNSEQAPENPLPKDRLRQRSAPGVVDTEQGRFYKESLNAGGRVLVFGAGHVARKLVPLLGELGFRCVVLDDRPEFVDAQVFPTAEMVCTVDFTEIGKIVTIEPADYVVIMTRGHQHDYECQAHALRCKPCYIGVMGSRHKIAYVTARLLADGFTQREIDACQMPIGTDILAQTPEEIAVSVAGELIRRRALQRKAP